MSQELTVRKPGVGASAYIASPGRFRILHDYKPRGDQPKAIEALARGIHEGQPSQTLLGVTGSGKTYTVACVIERVQRPTLLLTHNKTLAAQLCAELRGYFPENAVEYFVSYYDYYQPEAYIPQADIYIEKDADVNEEIDRLRHAATHALLSRRDVIVVASVSCIYGIGAPELYEGMALKLRVGDFQDRDDMLRQLVSMQYTRTDVLARGRFRSRGDVVEIYPADAEVLIRAELFGDEIERLSVWNPLTGELLSEPPTIDIFPATHYVVPEEKLRAACEAIEGELEERVEWFRAEEKLLEAQRIEQRTRSDLEMMRVIGSCKGVENYSRHLEGRTAGEPPFTLIDYFPPDFLLVIDECHQAVPQVRGMWAGDRSRKENLINFGFRLPSALDNRPLDFAEFEGKQNQVIYVSATPSAYELHRSGEQIVEMIVRPTGLIDPAIEIRPVRGQIDDLVGEVRKCAEKGQRSLVLTLTKRMAEDLTVYLDDLGVRVRYLHSDVHTLDRTETLRDLRLGEFDVLVGINLLREGLDLPEVALVAILDAGSEGFLRTATTLIQIVGRAARNVDGRVLMYSDHVSDAMRVAVDETNRRRAIQQAYNEEHGITPTTIQKAVQQTVRAAQQQEAQAGEILRDTLGDDMDQDLEALAEEKEAAMLTAAAELNFEEAARLRDELSSLRRLLRADQRSLTTSRPEKATAKKKKGSGSRG